MTFCGPSCNSLPRLLLNRHPRSGIVRSTNHPTAYTRTLSVQRQNDGSRPGFCFDIDGVLKQGSFVLPEAKEALKILSGQNAEGIRFPFILCTNGGGVSESKRSQKLTKELGVPISPKSLVQSHTIFNQFVPMYHDKPVLVVGGASDRCRKIAEEYGFSRAYTPQDFVRWDPAVWPFCKLSGREMAQTKEEDFSKAAFSAIFVMHDPFDWGLATQISLDLLTSADGTIINPLKRLGGEEPRDHIPIYFSNPDIIWGNEFRRPRLGQGAFQIALRENYRRLTGQELKVWIGGKPSRDTYLFADNLLQDVSRQIDQEHGKGTLNNVYMVGDNPASDIQGANKFGWKSILVQTGVFQGERPTESEFPPTIVKPNVLEAVKWALSQEGYSLL